MIVDVIENLNSGTAAKTFDLYTSASVGQLADSWQDYKKNNLETETGK